MMPNAEKYGRRRFMKSALSGGIVVGAIPSAVRSEGSRELLTDGPEKTWDVYEEIFPFDDEDNAATIVSSVLNWWGTALVPRPGEDQWEHVFDTGCVFSNQKTDGTRGYAFEKHSLSATSLLPGGGKFNVGPNGSDSIGAATNESPRRDDMEGAGIATVETILSGISTPFDFYFTSQDLWDAYKESGFDVGNEEKMEWSDSFWTGRSDMSHYSWILVDQKQGGEDGSMFGSIEVESEVEASYSVWDAKAKYQINFSEDNTPPWRVAEKSVKMMNDHELREYGITKINPTTAKRLSGKKLPPVLAEQSVKEKRPIYWTTNIPMEVSTSIQFGE